MSNLQEECGVFGIMMPERSDVASSVYYGLFALQHRGQQSCGITVNDDGVFSNYKDLGIVNDVFTRANLEKLFADNGNIVSGPVIAELEKMGISHKNGEDYLLPSEIVKRNY